jgi:TRAP-type mannitol/chloroaromatic compound transport system permease small subunit
VYGTLFMMAGAYTLSKNGHVRGDVLYGFFPPRLQAASTSTLYICSSFPACSRSSGPATRMPRVVGHHEHSNVTADGPPIYPFKTFFRSPGRSSWCRASSRSSAA